MNRIAGAMLGLAGLLACGTARAEESITPEIVIPSLERLEAGLKAAGITKVALPSAWLRSLGLLEVVNPNDVVHIDAGDLVDKLYVRDVLEPWWKRIVIQVPVKEPMKAEAALPQNADFGAHEIKVGERSWFARVEHSVLLIAPAKRIVQRSELLGSDCGPGIALLTDHARNIAKANSERDVIVSGGAGTLRNAVGLWAVSNKAIPSWVHDLTNDIDEHFLTVKLGKDAVRVELALSFIETTPLSKVTSGSQSAVELLDWMPAGEFAVLASVDPDNPGLRTLSGRLLELLGDNDTSALATSLRMMREAGKITGVLYTPQVDPANVGWISGSLVHWNARAGARPDATMDHFRTMVNTWGLLTTDETDGSSWSAGGMALMSTPVDTWELWPRTGLARSRLAAEFFGPAPGARGMAATREDRGWLTLGQQQGVLAESLRPTGPRSSLAENPRISAANASLPPDCAARIFIDPQTLLPVLQRMFPEKPLTLPDSVALIAVGLRFEASKLTLTAIVPTPVVRMLEPLCPDIPVE